MATNLHFIEICLAGPVQIKWNNEINTLPVNLFEVHVKRWLRFARNLLNPPREPRRGAHAAVSALTPTRALFFLSPNCQYGERSEAQHAHHLCGKLWRLLRLHAQPAAPPAAGTQDLQLLYQLLEAQQQDQAWLGDDLRLQETGQH